MWIVTNKSYLSVVESSKDNTKFIVRARVKGDIESFFSDLEVDVIETENTDYRFRTFVDKEVFKSQILKEINNIDYSNFKDSVKDYERKTWYTKIWSIMYGVQQQLYRSSRIKWWETHKHDKNFSTTSYGKNRKN
jgi:hypothetical protein